MYASNDGVQLYWDEAGAGTPVLLIMGHLYPSDMWWPVLPALTEHHRVIWFDNRGSGRSDTPPTATLADLAEDARTVLDAAGVDRAHVYGVSMGGGIALKLALEHPDRVRSLLLGCTAMKTADLPAGKPTKWRYQLPTWLLRAVMKRTYGSACPPELAKKDLDILFSSRIDAAGGVLQTRAIHTYDVTPDRVAALDVPALVLHGTEDQTVPYERGQQLAAALPGAELATYDGAGHNYLVACNEASTADTLDFLRRVDERQGAVA